VSPWPRFPRSPATLATQHCSGRSPAHFVSLVFRLLNGHSGAYIRNLPLLCTVLTLSLRFLYRERKEKHVKDVRRLRHAL
jgi:hypothetical protein